jgi:hypothetical protein
VDFEPSGFENRPPLRRKYKKEVAHAVNKLLSLQWDKETVLLLPTEIVAGLPGGALLGAQCGQGARAAHLRHVQPQPRVGRLDRHR